MKIAFTEVYKLSYDNNLLIVESMYDDIEIEKQHILECFQATEKLTLGEKYLIMALPNKNTSITMDAQREGMSDKYLYNVIAYAIVIHSSAQRILANFMLRFYKIKCPCSAHSSRENAMVWLNRQWNSHVVEIQ